MACFLLNSHNTSIAIPTVELTENFTVYHITVKIGDCTWKVQHRYNEFVELHDRLVSENGVAKDLLPPKKVIGNRDPSFVEKRRAALEKYLQTVVHFLEKAMPRELAVFLDFHLYDILFLLQNMALQFFHEGDILLEISKHYAFSTLQLYAISERLKQPCPEPELQDRRLDFSHVLDFCSHLTSMTVRGSSVPAGTSNIVPSSLKFELSSFRQLRKLVVADVPAENVYGLGTLRTTLTSLGVHFASVTSLAQFLLCDEIHREVSHTGARHLWVNVAEASFSHNSLKTVDESVGLLPAVERLDLSHNSIGALSNFTALPRLSVLNLSANCIAEVESLHVKVGKIVHLDLSQNRISALGGFSRLYSLESLDLGSNLVAELSEIKHISNLPCLENLVLIGNPVAIEVDYRIKVLEQFGSRAGELCLDNEKPTSKELDTVAVLQALRIVKEGRTPTFNTEAPVFPQTP